MEATIKVIYGCDRTKCPVNTKCLRYTNNINKEMVTQGVQTFPERKVKYYVIPKHINSEGCEHFVSL